MHNTYTTLCRLLITITLFLLPASQVLAQWEGTGNIQREEPTNTPMGPDIIKGTPTRVAADANNGLAVITNQKTLWRFDGKAWTWVNIPQFSGGLTNQYFFEDVAVHGKKVYVATGDGSIYVAEEATGWKELPGGGKAKRIAIDNNGQLWMIALDASVQVYNDESWTAYGEIKARDIAVYNGIPVVAGYGQGYLFVGKDGKWQQLTKDWTGVNHLSIDPTTGTLWVITGSVWAYTAEGWKKYAEKGEYFDICALSGTPYTLHKGNKIMKGISTDAVWRTAGSLVAAEPAAAATAEMPAPAPAAPALDPNAPYLRTEKTAYKTNEYFEVEFGNFQGSTFDWITLIEKDKPDDETGTFKYTTGQKNGKVAFSYAWAGTYELRGFFNNGKEVKARVTITIE